MSEQRYAMTVTAVGEVRDIDGNLITTQPVEAVVEFTAAELVERGIPLPKEK